MNKGLLFGLCVVAFLLWLYWEKKWIFESTAEVVSNEDAIRTDYLKLKGMIDANVEKLNELNKMIDDLRVYSATASNPEAIKDLLINLEAEVGNVNYLIEALRGRLLELLMLAFDADIDVDIVELNSVSEGMTVRPDGTLEPKASIDINNLPKTSVPEGRVAAVLEKEGKQFGDIIREKVNNSVPNKESVLKMLEEEKKETTSEKVEKKKASRAKKKSARTLDEINAHRASRGKPPIDRGSIEKKKAKAKEKKAKMRQMKNAVKAERDAIKNEPDKKIRKKKLAEYRANRKRVHLEAIRARIALKEAEREQRLLEQQESGEVVEMELLSSADAADMSEKSMDAALVEQIELVKSEKIIGDSVKAVLEGKDPALVNSSVESITSLTSEETEDDTREEALLEKDSVAVEEATINEPVKGTEAFTMVGRKTHWV